MSLPSSTMICGEILMYQVSVLLQDLLSINNGFRQIIYYILGEQERGVILFFIDRIAEVSADIALFIAHYSTSNMSCKY